MAEVMILTSCRIMPERWQLVFWMKNKGMDSIFLNIICATGRWTKGMPLQGLNMMSETVESGKCLHEVDDSCFLAWFIAQGHGKEKRKARYFCIMTINDIVDVISTDEPCFF